MAKPKKDKKDKKGKEKTKDKKIEVDQEETVPQTPPEPKFLSETEAIYFWKAIGDGGSDLDVPPSTPTNISNLIVLPKPFPNTFPKFEDFTVPYVREVGVKKCIEEMGKYLHCTNYAFDYLQFWFVDALVDCLWKAQDEYYLGEDEQRMVLRWVVYIFTLMTDPITCFSRKEFFKIFKEMIFMAADLLNEGNAKIPPPEEVCVFIPKQAETTEEQSMSEEESRSSEDTKSSIPNSKSDSTLSFSSCKSDDIIEMEIGDQKRTFTIKKKKCFCHLDDACGDNFDLPTSVSSTFCSSKHSMKVLTNTELQSDIKEAEQKEITATEMTAKTIEDESAEVVDDVEEFPNKYYKVFHQPDPDVPKRFMPLMSPSSKKLDISIDGFTYTIRADEGGAYEGLEMDVDKDYINCQPKDTVTIEEELLSKRELLSKSSRLLIKKQSVDPQSSVVVSSKRSFLSQTKSNKGLRQSTSANVIKTASNLKQASTVHLADSNDKITDEMIMQRLQKFKLLEKRMQDLADPRVGWPAPDEDEEKIVAVVQPADTINVDDEDWEELVSAKEISRKDENLYIGLGVLLVVTDFVFDYFYRNFHYTLIKLATRSIPSVITQTVNAEWKVPKAIKDEFRRPKQEKPKKEKKAKKGKKDKKSKKSKTSSKSSKKSKGKKDKKSKKSSKSSKSSKGSKKKEKAAKLTKEQKAELERQRRLQEEYEAVQRRLQENLRFMFPLTDAANDQLFEGIFENWEKPKERSSAKEKKDKKKKGKKK